MSWSQVSRRLLAAAAIGIGVAAVCAWGLVADRLDGVQNLWEDRLQPGLASSDDVVVVGIDRDTLLATEPWPWPRDLHAELLDRIGADDPAVVLYDVLLVDPGEGDDALVAAMGETPTVLPTALTLTAGEDGPPQIVDAIVPADPFAAAAAALGHANISRSGDTGVVRTLPAYALDERGIARPSIALAAVSVVEGAVGPLTERPGGVQVGDRFIPLDDAELTLNWSPTLEQQTVIPAIDVLSGAVDADAFRDRVVLVGITEPTLGDQQLVPTDRSGSTSGVVVLANAVNTILSSGYLGRPSIAAELGLLAVAVAAVMAMFAALRLVPALIGVCGSSGWRRRLRHVAVPQRRNALERRVAGARCRSGGSHRDGVAVLHRSPTSTTGVAPVLHRTFRPRWFSSWRIRSAWRRQCPGSGVT